jgi:hypothetical protein
VVRDRRQRVPRCDHRVQHTRHHYL